MATFTKKLLARNCTITVIPCLEENGVLTEQTAFALTGRAGRVSTVRRRTTEEISGNDSLNEHHETVKKGFQVSVEAIKHIGASELEEVGELYTHCAIVIASPRASNIKSRKYWGLITEDAWDIEPGKNLDRLSIVPVDIGSANPLITYA